MKNVAHKLLESQSENTDPFAGLEPLEEAGKFHLYGVPTAADSDTFSHPGGKKEKLGQEFGGEPTAKSNPDGGMDRKIRLKSDSMEDPKKEEGFKDRAPQSFRGSFDQSADMSDPADAWASSQGHSLPKLDKKWDELVEPFEDESKEAGDPDDVNNGIAAPASDLTGNVINQEQHMARRVHPEDAALAQKEAAVAIKNIDKDVKGIDFNNLTVQELEELQALTKAIAALKVSSKSGKKKSKNSGGGGEKKENPFAKKESSESEEKEESDESSEKEPKEKEVKEVEEKAQHPGTLAL